MKHILLSLCCSFFVASAIAQTIDVNFALASNGASAVATSGDAVAAIDGNLGTRWESASEDPQVWTLDLGQVREFNTIKIVWEAAYAKTFTVSTSLDSVAWTPIITIADQQLSDYTQIHTIDPTTARYIQFHGEARATQYGYSFWEFEVYMAGESVLTSLEAFVDVTLLKVGETAPIQLLARDQHGKSMQLPEQVIYTITPSTAGVVNDHVFTALQMGPSSIVASVGEVAAEPIELVAYDGENLALSTPENNKIIAESTPFTGYDAFRAVDGLLHTEWQGCPDNGTLDTDSARTYDSWFVLDLGQLCNVNMITIVFEGACAQDYHVDFSLDNVSWNTVYNHLGQEGINHHTQPIYGEALQSPDGVRYVRFWSTKAATQWGVKIFEFQVFGSPLYTTSLPEVSAGDAVAEKIISNGHLIIIRDGVKYDIQGVRL